MLQDSKLRQKIKPSSRQLKQRQQIMQHLVLSSACFQCYWPDTSLSTKNITELHNQFQELGIPTETFQSYLQKVEGRYSVDLSMLTQPRGDNT